MRKFFSGELNCLIRIVVLTLSVSSLFSTILLSQNNKICSSGARAEKIYLQLDGKVYTTDKIIWFKAIVAHAVNHLPTRLSGVLYVELIGPDERIVEKKLVKLNNGIGVGHFDLYPKYAEGVYQVRAYTEWNKNFDADFIFREYIQVFAPGAKLKPEDPIRNVVVIATKPDEHRLHAILDPSSIDSLHKKELKLFLTIDDKKDSITIKRSSENKYLLDYPLPEGSQLVTLQIQTRNQFTYAKTVALDESILDLQFFPESGELVDGLQGRIGFKALDYAGKGKMVEGEIVNGEGSILATFKSNELGMGSFVLPFVDVGIKYFARVAPSTPGSISKIYPLPAIVPKGNVISVVRRREHLVVKAASNYLLADSVSVMISCRGYVYFNLKGPFRDKELVLSLPTRFLPEGIIAFTLMDSTAHPLAERLYFNELPDNRLNIRLSVDKDSVAQREPTNLTIETTAGNGKPVHASLSLLVLNEHQLGKIQTARQNILSSFLLGSELKGEIENPGYYFSKSVERQYDLDALMLTQGWRRYLFTRPPEKIRFQAEPSLALSGTVGGIFVPNKKKVADLTMMTFGKNRMVQKQRTDSLGRFYFDLNDEYGQNLNVLIQSSDKAGKNVNYTIRLDKKIAPPIVFNHVKAVEKVDSVVQALVKKNGERKAADDAFKLSAGDILLGEVVVEAYRMTPARKQVTEKYGKADVVIDGKTIQDKEQKWSYGLYSVLLSSFPDKVIVRRDGDGNLYAKVKNSEMTLVVIDGVPVKDYDYPAIANIPPGEVSSFEIIEGANNFSRLFMDAFPEASPLDAPAWGDVIAIYTYGGQGIYGARSPVGIVKTTVPVFSVPREFYAPKYVQPDSINWYKPDLRALVHWEPEVKVDSLGRGSSVFYNADNTGQMRVVVEGISDHGEIGYSELKFNVVKNKLKK